MVKKGRRTSRGESPRARNRAPDHTRLIRLLGTIAQAAASAATVPDMLRVAVNEICRFLKWPVGHALVPSATSAKKLVSTGIWHLDDAKRFASFRRVSRSFPNIERGLIGRAAAAKKAVHASDISDQIIKFTYLDEARKGGLTSGIVLPVMAGKRVIAVLEFYTTVRAEPDAPLLAALDQIAHHIGHVAERVRARSAQRRLSDAIEGIGDGVALFDKDERLVLFNRRYAATLSTVADILKLGVTFEEIVRTSVKRGYYGQVGEDWAAERLRRFRAREDVEYAIPGPGGRLDWYARRHYRTADGGTLLVRTDITERKRAEAELETARQRFADAIEGISDGIALFDKDERLVQFNRRYAAVMPAISNTLKPGAAFENIVRALAKRNYYGPVDEAWIVERLRRFRKLEDTEFSVIELDGERRWHALRHYRTRDGGTLFIRTDITERKRAEAEKESAQQLLQTALDSMTDGVALFDKDERLVLYNEDFARRNSSVRDILKPGMTFTEFIKTLVERDWYISADKDFVNRRIHQFRTLESTELQINDPNLGARWVHMHHYRTRDGGTFLVRTDITKLKHAEAELKSAQQLLQTALDSMTDGVALFDKDERLVLFNENFIGRHKLLLGFIKPGITFTELVEAQFKLGAYIGADKDLVGQRVRQFRALEAAEILMRDPDRGERWVHMHLYRTRDGGTFLVRTDITERKRAEAERESAQQLLQTALDSMIDGVALFDKDEQLVLFSKNYLVRDKLPPGFLKPGMTFSELIGFLAERGAYAGGGKDFVAWRVRQFRALEPVELRLRDPDGREHWAYVRHYRTRDSGTFLIDTDITERKRAEADLESSQQLLQTALDSMTDGVALFDKDERLVLFNESYARKVRLPREILKPGITFTELVTNLMARGAYVGADKKWMDERIRKFRALEPVEMCLRDPDGSERWYNVHLYRTRDGGTFLVRTDITERKRAAAKLESAQHLLQTALESMTDGVALFDKNERLVLWNEGYIGTRPQLRDFVKPGLTFTEIIGHLAEQGGYIGVGKDWVETRLRRFRALEPIEFCFHDFDGNERWAFVHHYRTRDGGTLLIRADITERVLAMREIERARIAAEAASAAKTKFLASMSHELRTPLNAILGFAQMLDLGAGKITEAKNHEYLAIILKSGQHLLDLVSHILELSKVESQDVGLNIEVLSPANIAQHCLDMVQEEAKRRAVIIVDRIGAPGPDLRFRGDPVRVRQVLLNLLSNAVKYNRPGGQVTLSCVRNGDGTVRFAVADTGLGIPPERHGEVFQPFQRLGREGGAIEGSGIGLALARQLVERMGGSIGFASAPERGSTFWFDLPEAGNESRA